MRNRVKDLTETKNTEQSTVSGSSDALCRCDSCGWVGRRTALAADYTMEAWSNTVCPECGAWDDIEDVPVNEPSS